MIICHLNIFFFRFCLNRVCFLAILNYAHLLSHNVQCDLFEYIWMQWFIENHIAERQKESQISIVCILRLITSYKRSYACCIISKHRRIYNCVRTNIAILSWENNTIDRPTEEKKRVKNVYDECLMLLFCWFNDNMVRLNVYYFARLWFTAGCDSCNWHSQINLGKLSKLSDMIDVYIVNAWPKTYFAWWWNFLLNSIKLLCINLTAAPWVFNSFQSLWFLS